MPYLQTCGTQFSDIGCVGDHVEPADISFCKMATGCDGHIIRPHSSSSYRSGYFSYVHLWTPGEKFSYSEGYPDHWYQNIPPVPEIHTCGLNYGDLSNPRPNKVKTIRLARTSQQLATVKKLVPGRDIHAISICKLAPHLSETCGILKLRHVCFLQRKQPREQKVQIDDSG